LTGLSRLPEGLPSDMNDRGNWATRGMLRFQPTLDQDWLLTFNLSKRNQYAEVGQSIGTGANTTRICDQHQTFAKPECEIGPYGTNQGDGRGSGSVGYQPHELVRATNKLNRCIREVDWDLPQPASIRDESVDGCETNERGVLVRDEARVALSKDLVLDDEPFEGDFNRAGKVKLDVWSVSLKGDIAIGDSLSFRSVSGFDNYDRSNLADLDFSPNVLFEIGTDDEGWQFVQDFQLSGALSQELPVNWQLGGFALIEKLDAFTDIFLPDLVQGNAVTQRDWTQKLYSAAGYFSFDWDFWNDFTLDGGVRYNWEKKTLDMTTFGNAKRPDNPSLFGIQEYRVTDISESDTWQAPTGTIRLTYRFREDTHAYWKYTRGWKGGHYNVTVSDLGVVTTAKPEEIDAFEIGLRGSWFNGRLGLNASVFHYAYRDYQIFTVVIPLTGTPEFQVLNASDAEVYGGELELTARPISGMFLEARFGWLESQFLDFKQTQTQIQTIGTTKVSISRELDFSGNRLLNSPPFKVSLTAEQTIPLGRLGSLTARWDGAWSDETSYDASEGAGTPTFEGINIFPDNTIGQPAFWLHNFRLGYRTPDGSVELSAFVRNATDELYKTYAFDVSGIPSNATTIHFLGEPRTYGLGLTVNF
jgi:iron complex outermembrane receptor protein